MSAKAYKGNEVIDGTWHFTPESLKELDNILDDAWKWMQKERKRLINYHTTRLIETANASLTSANMSPEQRDNLRLQIKTRETDRLDDYGNDKNILITFRSGVKLNVASFHDAFSNPSAAKEVPSKFKIVLTAARMKLEIEESTFLGTSLRINITPHDSDRLWEFMIRITQWAESCQLPAWQRYWRSCVGWHWPLLCVVASIALGVSEKLNPATDGSYALKQEAIELLKDGLAADEIIRANEIVLSLLSGNYSRTPGGPSLISVLATVIGFVLFGVLFSHAPSTTIGIGLGKQMIERQRTMIKIIKCICGFLFLGVATSYLASFLYEFTTVRH